MFFRGSSCLVFVLFPSPVLSARAECGYASVDRWAVADFLCVFILSRYTTEAISKKK